MAEKVSQQKELEVLASFGPQDADSVRQNCGEGVKPFHGVTSQILDKGALIRDFNVAMEMKFGHS